jgi:hypothetical protein
VTTRINCLGIIEIATELFEQYGVPRFDRNCIVGVAHPVLQISLHMGPNQG